MGTGNFARRPKMRIKESAVERRLVSGVKARGGLCWKFVSPGMSGVPDRIVLLPGARIVFVELKRPGGGVMERQHCKNSTLWLKQHTCVNYLISYIFICKLNSLAYT